MRKYKDLTIHEKIQIKQHAINLYGKRWHTMKPDFISCLNELQIISILGR
jgi:hypothetical protein